MSERKKIFLKEYGSNSRTQPKGHNNRDSKEDTTQTESKESRDVAAVAVAATDADTDAEVTITKPPTKETVASESEHSDIEDEHKNRDSKQAKTNKSTTATAAAASTAVDTSSSPKFPPGPSINREVESSAESEDSRPAKKEKEDKEIIETRPVSPKRKADTVDKEDYLIEEDDDDARYISRRETRLNSFASDRSQKTSEERHRDKQRVIMSGQLKEMSYHHRSLSAPPVASSPATATAALSQQIDSSTLARNLSNVPMGLANPALQLPLSSQTMFSANAQGAGIGGLTGQNADIFMQGYAAAQATTQAKNPMSNLNVAPSSVFNIPSFHARDEKRLRRGETSEAYRDFSRLPRSLEEAENGSSAPTTSTGKEPPFPVKLHRILSNPEYSDLISWLPHGRSWRVLKPKAFEEKIVPRYFRHTKYASFMRQVNGWGFKRMTQGPDHNSYYHELFLRGLPHLCTKMRRPTRAKMGQNESNNNPDFYRLNLIAPLPNGDRAGGNSGPAPSVGNDFLLSALNSNGNNTTEQIGYGSFSGGGMELSQSLQGTLPQNLGALGQFSGFNPSLQGMGGGIGSMTGSTNTDINQLDALRQRKDNLMRQLQGLQSAQNTMGALHSLQVGQTSPSQLGPGGNQFQQMMNMPDNMPSQMGGLQFPGIGMNGSNQMNMGSLAGNTPTQSAALNQQLLMQQGLMGANNGNMGNIGMINNNNMSGPELNHFNAMMQNQNFNAQFQLQQQQQHQQQQQQQQQQQSTHFGNQLGNLPQGRM